MKTIRIIVVTGVLLGSVAHANLIDLTPGGFTIDPDGDNIPPAYLQAVSQLHFDTSLSPVFGLGPWLFANDGGLGGQYLFSNLFDISPTLSALISWNLTGQPDGDWLTYVVLFGHTGDGNGTYNVYGVNGGRFQSDWQSVLIDGNSIIDGIAFYGLNPAFPTPDTGSTLLLSALGLAGLFVAIKLKFARQPNSTH